MAHAIRKLTPEQELREDLAWDLRLALRDGKQVVFRFAADVRREDAAHAIYEASIGTPALTGAWQAAVQAVARREQHGRIGELFAAFVQQASAHYVEILADCAEDREYPRRVTFERPEVWA